MPTKLFERTIPDDVRAEIVSAMRLRRTLRDKELMRRFNVSRSALWQIEWEARGKPRKRKT